MGTALCAGAQTFELLIVGRVLQAAGAGVQLPLVGVVPMLIFPPEKRGTAMGMAGIVMSCAPAAGPVLAGGIIDAWGWRMMFWAMIPLAILVLAVSFFLLTNVGELKRCLLYTSAPAASIESGWRSVIGCSYKNSFETARAITAINSLLGCWGAKGGALITSSPKAGAIEDARFKAPAKPAAKRIGDAEYPLVLPLSLIHI